jgi:hypothetical protein
MKNNIKEDDIKTEPVSPYSTMKSSADDAVVMHIFNLVEEFPQITQKKITSYTGIAAGLAHSYMRKIVSKGWIKARQVSAKRWLYFMTPDGFAEKSRLTVKYLGNTLRTYKVAQTVVEEHLELCLSNGWGKLVVVGGNELADIAVLNINGTKGLTLAGKLINGEATNTRKAGVFHYSEIGTLEYDRVLVCDPGFADWAGKNKNLFVIEKQMDILGKVLENSL